MEPEAERRRPYTFVIQVTPTLGGDLAGLVRHVRTGERRQFEGLDGLAEAIRTLARANDAEPTPPRFLQADGNLPPTRAGDDPTRSTQQPGDASTR